VSRLELLNLISTLCTPNDLNTSSPILTIPKETWSSLVDWCFQYKHNNFYLTAFRSLFTLLLQTNEAGQELTKYLFLELNLLIKLIDFANAKLPRCSLHGFVIEIGNQIRTLAEQKKSSEFLLSYLNENSKWTNFLPLLRELTITQTTPMSAVNNPPFRVNRSLSVDDSARSPANGVTQEPSLATFDENKEGL